MNLLPPYSLRVWKTFAAVIGGLILIAIVLFALDRFGTWRSNRDIDKRKANINAVLANIETKESTIANLQTEVALEKQAANIETKALLENINTTEATKEETNRALGNLANAKGKDTTNSSVADLEKLLKQLEQ